jgi:cell wall-associated NlpC family hydrolase
MKIGCGNRMNGIWKDIILERFLIMIRLMILLFLFLSCFSISFAQSVSLPATPVYPVNTVYSGYTTYPIYSGYTRQVEGKLFTAKDYWAAKRKAFSEGNVKNVRSAQEHGLKQVIAEREERYSDRVNAAKDVFGTNKQSSSTDQTDSSVSSEESTPPDSVKATVEIPTVTPDSVKATVEIPTVTPSVTKPSLGVISGSKLSGDGSFMRINVARILNEQLGAPYSSDGESPEDGFSPVGLIRYVTSRLGIVPTFSTVTGLWESWGLFLQVPYGQFQTADILFFKLFSKSAQEGELFVALALDDEFMVYPSFTRKKVIKRSYKEDFWRKHFIGAKRVPPQMR